MKLKKKFMTGVVAAGVAGVTAVTGANTAFASGREATHYVSITQESWFLSYDGKTRASATSEQDNSSYDEVIWLNERDSDGWGVRVYWRGAGKSGICYNENGDGTRTACIVSFAEGTWYYWQVCSKNGSTILACAPEESALA